MGTTSTKERKQTSFRISRDKWLLLRQYCDENGKSMDEILNEIVEKLIEKHKKKIDRDR